jgi:trk system potassium uptake protein TrkA
MAQVAVIGLGRFGFHVARNLYNEGHEVLAIDVDPDNVQRVKDCSTKAIVMDARDKDKLSALGLNQFDYVVVSLGERVDASALITLHLRDLGVRHLITKAGSEDHAALLERIGAHEVVQPERDSAERLARRLENQNVIEMLPLGDHHSVSELAPPTSFLGKSLREMDLRARFGVQVVAIQDSLTGDLEVNPSPEFRIKDSDVLVVLGTNRDVARLRKL